MKNVKPSEKNTQVLSMRLKIWFDSSKTKWNTISLFHIKAKCALCVNKYIQANEQTRNLCAYEIPLGDTFSRASLDF